MSRTDDTILAAAVAEGKIAADRATIDHYRRQLAGSQAASYRKLLTARVADGGLMAGQVINGQQPVGLNGPEAYPSAWVERPRRSVEVTAEQQPAGRRRRVQVEKD